MNIVGVNDIVDENLLLISKSAERTERSKMRDGDGSSRQRSGVRCLVWGTVCDISGVLISSASDI